MKKILTAIICLTIIITKVNAEELTVQIEKLKENIDALEETIQTFNQKHEIYPIGSIYITTENKNPQTTLCGTWEKYAQGKKLIGVGNNGISEYTVNQTGGNSSITLTTANLPAHTHTLTPTGSVSSTFTGKSVTTSSSGAHTHTISFKLSADEAKGYGLVYSTEVIAYHDRGVVLGGSSTFSVAGAHTHTLTSTGTVTSTFTGTKATTSSIGSSSAINIQNPYITVYIWKRVG